MRKFKTVQNQVQFDFVFFAYLGLQMYKINLFTKGKYKLRKVNNKLLVFWCNFCCFNSVLIPFKETHSIIQSLFLIKSGVNSGAKHQK